MVCVTQFTLQTRQKKWLTICAMMPITIRLVFLFCVDAHHVASNGKSDRKYHIANNTCLKQKDR